MEYFPSRIHATIILHVVLLLGSLASSSGSRPLSAVAQPQKGHPERTYVGVRGIVYCKSCKYAGVDTLLDAKPISGKEVVVQFRCENTMVPLILNTTRGADKNGFFYILMGPNSKTITNFGAHKCKAFLLPSSPLANCSKPSDLNGGISGGTLRRDGEYDLEGLPLTVFSVGPFAFEPTCPH